MITKCKELLTPLVEEYSKVRAKETMKNENATSGESSGEEYLVPLTDVAKSVGNKYPALMDLQNQYDYARNNNNDGNTLLWSANTNDGPLVEFCRRALFSGEFQRLCTRSVKAESDRLNAIQHGVSVSTQASLCP